jgi:hypothetical protein
VDPLLHNRHKSWNNDFIIFHSINELLTSSLGYGLWNDWPKHYIRSQLTTNQNISTHTKNNFNNNIDSFWRPPQFPSLSAHPQDTTTFFICHGSRKIIYGEGWFLENFKRITIISSSLLITTLKILKKLLTTHIII